MTDSGDVAHSQQADSEEARVLVTGSRTWADQQAVWDALDRARYELGRIVVVHGDCRTGADAHARNWVRTHRHHDVRTDPHPAQWQAYGPQAGPIRNTEMVRLGAVVCLAFLDPCRSVCSRPQPHWSHGASHCADLAESYDIPTHRHYPGGPR